MKKKYKVNVLPKAAKTIKEIDRRYVGKILERLTLLETDPRHHGSIKLSGSEDAYRTRVGIYRIIYKVYEDKILVAVVDINHRKDVYR
jgi:mRNA interferase RelE/StbE